MYYLLESTKITFKSGDKLNNLKKAKTKSSGFINNRHLYVGNIIKQIFKPEEYNYLCEVGAGEMNLAKILAESYKRIDAYEIYPQAKSQIDNLNIYGTFSKHVEMEKYDLLVSVCPYYYNYDFFDDRDSEVETVNLLYDIINLCLEKNIDLFLILSDTEEVTRFVKRIYKDPKYKQLIYDAIDLYYLNFGGKEVSSSHNLILKKNYQNLK